MSNLFFRNPRYFALVIALIISAGVSSILTIGRQEDPTITNLFATIITPYPGATPARVEALVTEKIEEELRELEVIKVISSVSRTGVSVISVELSEFIDDTTIEQTWSEIRDALADAEINFPQGVGKSDFDNDRTGAYTTLSAITSADGVNVSPGILKRYAEQLQNRLRAVSGTELVRLFGDQDEEVLVAVDPDRLVSLGLTVNDVAAAISAADTKVEAGRVRGDHADYLIEVGGEIEDLDRVRAVPILTAATGQITRIGDIASVSRSVRTPESSMAITDGVAAVVVAAKMQPDLQVDVWAAAAERVLLEFERDLPGGITHDLLFNQARYTVDRLTGLGINLLIGVGLVIAVMLVTLGWRAALVVAAVLPLTALLSVSILQRLEIPIHQMSVTGLIVALGLLVDAAIVMTDEIRRRIVAGMARAKAVSASVKRLAAPLLASTVTTVLAFMPMAILPGPAGDFVGSIAISVIVMLLSSLLLALTITPAMAGFILPDHAEGSDEWWRLGVMAAPIQDVFKRSLDWALANRGLSVAVALTLPIMGFVAFPTLTAQFFPGVDRDQFYVQIRLPEGA
ncbi:MAG: efflux RND transporter permease subunit, partial [Rhodospirillaceae bacterium]